MTPFQYSHYKHVFSSFNCFFCLFEQGFCRCYFLHGCNHRKHNRYISKCRSSENRAKLWKEQFFFFHHNTYSTQPNRRICLFSKIYTSTILSPPKSAIRTTTRLAPIDSAASYKLERAALRKQFASHFHIQKFAPE